MQLDSGVELERVFIGIRLVLTYSETAEFFEYFPKFGSIFFLIEAQSTPLELLPRA